MVSIKGILHLKMIFNINVFLNISVLKPSNDVNVFVFHLEIGF